MSKVIVLTGASSGIGAALTRRLAADGHRLFVCARRKDKLIEVTDNGRLARWIAADVADESAVKNFAEFVSRDVAAIDALICCAGAYGPIGPMATIDPAAWWASIQANLYGTFLSIRYFAQMMTGGDGRIIVFSGGGAFNPLPRYSAYAASKTAIVRLMETAAEELQSRGIAVNAIAPGFVNTEIHDATLAAGPEAAGSEFFAMTQAKIRDGAIPIDIPTECVRFLLSDDARGLTGRTISANFDPWRSTVFKNNINAIMQTDLYTLRRINLGNLENDGIVAALAAVSRAK